MIKVLHERHCQANKEAEYQELLKQLRYAAMKQRGHATGETLHSVDDPSVSLVIGTWSTKEAWQTWHNSAARREITDKIESLLTEPVKVSAFESIY